MSARNSPIPSETKLTLQNLNPRKRPTSATSSSSNTNTNQQRHSSASTSSLPQQQQQNSNNNNEQQQSEKSSSSKKRRLKKRKNKDDEKNKSAASIQKTVADLVLSSPYVGARDLNGRFNGKKCRIVLQGDIEYIGDLFHGRKHGVGIQHWPDGSSFCGEWFHGEAVGFGKLSFPGGGEYYGEVKGGVRHGLGVYRCGRDGTRYFGHWQNGRRHGFGIEIGEDGTYSGEWSEDSHHGWGTMQFGDSLNRYTGEWQHDAMHGVGSMLWVTLKGDTANKAKNLWRRASSRILMTLAAGSSLKNKQQHKENDHHQSADHAHARRNSNTPHKPLQRRGSIMGLATQHLLVHSDDMQQYIGEWNNGRPHGNGDLRRILLSTASSDDNDNNKNQSNTTNNTNTNTTNTSSSSPGNHPGKTTGQHRNIPFEMGNHFQGSFVNGKRDGFGIQYFADGSAFEGTWESNLKNGKGTVIRPDGNLVHIQLKNDTIVRDNSTLISGGAATNAAITSASSMSPGEVQHTHVDLSVSDICFTPSDEKSVHVTVSLVFVALRHLFHVYVAMQSACGNFDDVFMSQLYSKLPDGIQRRAKISEPEFVKNMSDEVKQATPIHHLSDFDGIVHLAEAHAQTTIELAAHGAHRAMKIVMNFEKIILLDEEIMKASSAKKSTTTKKKKKTFENASDDDHHDHDSESDEPLSPLSPRTKTVLRKKLSQSKEGLVSNLEAASSFYKWSGGEDLGMAENQFVASFSNMMAKEDEQNKNNSPTHRRNTAANVASSSDPFSDIPFEKEETGSPNSLNFLDDDEKGEGEKSRSERRNTAAPSKTTNNDGSDPSSPNSRSMNTAPPSPSKKEQVQPSNISIEELFGQYDYRNTGAGGGSSSNKTQQSERRPLSTVLQLAGFLSLLRDAEVLSPDLTGQDVLDCLAPLLKRRAHVPGSPGLTWPAFVEAIVRVSHKKLALSSSFCAQDSQAKSSLGSRLHHFVKEYLFPLLRCIKDLEACPEALAIMGVEQLEVATSENTTLESLRKATLRQLRQMAGGGRHSSHSHQNASHQQHQHQQHNIGNISHISQVASVSSPGSPPFSSNLPEQQQQQDDNDNFDTSSMISDTSTPRSISDRSSVSFSPMGAAAISQQELPATFDEALSSLSSQLAPVTPEQAERQAQQQLMKAPVTRGMELLQSLCGSSWAQFPAVVQCEIVEKICVSNLVSASTPASTPATTTTKKNTATTTQNQSGSGSGGVADTIEIWVAVAKPEKYSPNIRLHFLAVQVTKHTAEMKFVGFVPSNVIERLQLQSLKDPEFFLSSSKRLIAYSSSSATTAVTSSSTSANASINPAEGNNTSTASTSPASAAHHQQQQRQGVASSTSEYLSIYYPNALQNNDKNTGSSSFRKSSSCSLLQQQQQQHQQTDIFATSNNASASNFGSGSASQLLRRQSQMSVDSSNKASLKKGFPSSTSSAFSVFPPQQQQSQNKKENLVLLGDQIIKKSKHLVLQYVSCTALHQLLRGSRFFSTSSLRHYDSLVHLYHSCNCSLGPLLTACSFSGLLLYDNNNEHNDDENENDNNNKQKKENSNKENTKKTLPFSSGEALRHCIHALYGVDPSKGLFIDLRGSGLGLCTPSVSGGGKTVTSPTNTTSNNINDTSAATTSFNNNTNATNTTTNNTSSQSITTAADLVSPEEAVQAVMTALQNVTRHSGSHRASFSASALDNSRRFPEIAEAARAKAMQNQRNQEQRALYHCDNWRTRKEMTETPNQDGSWQLAACDLKLSFGEFVECMMIICGLAAKSIRGGDFDDEQKNMKTKSTSSSSLQRKDSSSQKSMNAADSEQQQQQQQNSSNNNLASTKTPGNESTTTSQNQENNKITLEQSTSGEEIGEALRGVMRAATKTMGKQFQLTSPTKSTSTNENTSFETPTINTSQQQQTTTASTSSEQQTTTTTTKTTTPAKPTKGVSKQIFCDMQLLDHFFDYYLPMIQYFVNVKNASPKLVPPYWSWAVIDAFDVNREQLMIFDELEKLRQQQQQQQKTVTTTTTNSKKGFTQQDLLDLRTEFLKSSLQNISATKQFVGMDWRLYDLKKRPLSASMSTSSPGKSPSSPTSKSKSPSRAGSAAKNKKLQQQQQQKEKEMLENLRMQNILNNAPSKKKEDNIRIISSRQIQLEEQDLLEFTQKQQEEESREAELFAVSMKLGASISPRRAATSMLLNSPDAHHGSKSASRQKSSPGHGKKNKNAPEPKIVAVTRQVQIGGSARDGASSRMPSMLMNEINSVAKATSKSIAEAEKEKMEAEKEEAAKRAEALLDVDKSQKNKSQKNKSSSATGTSSSRATSSSSTGSHHSQLQLEKEKRDDRNLDLKIRHPVSLQEAVAHSVLVEAPPLRFSVTKIEEDKTEAIRQVLSPEKISQNQHQGRRKSNANNSAMNQSMFAQSLAASAFFGEASTK